MKEVFGNIFGCERNPKYLEAPQGVSKILEFLVDLKGQSVIKLPWKIVIAPKFKQEYKNKKATS